MEERENGRANLQMRKKGLYIASARKLTVTGILTQNFRPGGGISAPLIKFPPLLQRVAPHLAEFNRGGNYRISVPR
jgi:hypothetical protein